MLPEFLSKLISLGYATYGRQSVGLSSVSNILAPQGQIIVLTKIEVLPWLNIIDSGAIQSVDNTYTAPDSTASTALKIGNLSQRSDYQLRIIADNSPDINYTSRGNITFDPIGLAVLGTSDQAAVIRSFSIEKQEFECLIYAKNKIQFSFALLQKVIKDAAFTFQALTLNQNSAYLAGDLPEVLGMQGEALPINYLTLITDLFGGVVIQQYYNLTQKGTSSGVPAAGLNQTDFIKYLMAARDTSPANFPFNPVYANSNANVLDLTSLPILNVEYVTFQAGNNTNKGYFDQELIKILKW